MSRKSIHFLVVIILLFTTSLACQAVSGVSDQVQDAQSTAQAAAEQIQELATQAPAVMETVQVLATQAPEMIDTVQAFATENPGLEQTAIAVATEGFSMGEAPADIPVVDRTTVTSFYGAADVVSYLTSIDFQTVVTFYKTEMPNNGWSADPSMTFEQGEAVILTYTKSDSTATVTITANPADQSTIIAIAIQAK